MTAYYNEIEPFAAQWLRNLIAAGHIAPGVVDDRSIEDVHPSDLREFTQCHFFAGIGIWSHALLGAGWPDDRPVWTGSCPCQPFSAAGQGAGFDDERHLWPAWHHLIKERRPAVVFGEQVASRDAGPWIDLVQDDLEAMGYAFGALPFPAASVGAPHIRDRLYFVAHTGGAHRGCKTAPAHRRESQTNGPSNRACELAHAKLQQRPGRERRVSNAHEACGRDKSTAEAARLCSDLRAWPVTGFWADADWLPCRDGKARPVERGTFPLVAGATNRVGTLRAYGNAICAPAAEAFIASAMGAMR